MARTIADELDVDEYWPSSDFLLGNVEELIANAASSGRPDLARWFSGVGLWPVTDNSGVTDGYLVTIDIYGTRIASLHQDVRDALSAEHLTGVDAAVDALCCVWDVVAELRGSRLGRVGEVLSDVHQWDAARAQLTGREDDPSSSVRVSEWERSEDRAAELLHELAAAVTASTAALPSASIEQIVQGGVSDV